MIDPDKLAQAMCIADGNNPAEKPNGYDSVSTLYASRAYMAACVYNKLFVDAKPPTVTIPWREAYGLVAVALNRSEEDTINMMARSFVLGTLPGTAQTTGLTVDDLKQYISDMRGNRNA